MTTTYRVRDAAEVLGISDDTLRRWIDSGRIAAVSDPDGPVRIDGTEVARAAVEYSGEPTNKAPIVNESARNRFDGVVTRVIRDTVMAQVEIQSGPHRVVSLMSREAADELKLEPGVRAVAAIKSTNVVVELPVQR
jgi:molybdopterin-binding protein